MAKNLFETKELKEWALKSLMLDWEYMELVADTFNNLFKNKKLPKKKTGKGYKFNLKYPGVK